MRVFGRRTSSFRGASCLANAVLLAVGTLTACGIAELVLRTTGLGSPSPMISQGELPFKRRPYASFVNRKENVNVVEVNNWGFHDRDRAPTKAGYRFVAFGDSFVEGNQVPVEQLFTSRIEASLRRRVPAVEMVNAGVGGVGTAYEYLLYKELFRGRVEMDHVVLFFMNGNDLPNNHPVLERHVNGNHVAGKVYVDGRGRVYVTNVQRSPRQRLLHFLDGRSALVYEIHSGLHELKKSWRRSGEAGGQEVAVPGASEQETNGLEDAWREAIEGTLHLLERWNRELEERRVELSVVVIPFADHYLRGHYRNPHKQAFVEALKVMGERRDIPVLELDFSDHDPYDIYSFDGELLGHFNERGHAETARQVAAWLLETWRDDLVPPS